MNNEKEKLVVEKNLLELCDKINSDKISTNNFNIKLFLWSIIFIILSIISMKIFEFSIGRNLEYGSIFGFEGFNWFYLNGLPLLIIGFVLFIFSILNFKKYTFFFNYGGQDLLRMKERKLFFFKIIYRIQKSQIAGIQIRNTSLCYKIIWLLIIYPYFFCNIQYGISLFYKSPMDWTISIINIIYSIISIAFIITILIFNEIELIIYTQFRLLYRKFSNSNIKFIRNKFIPKICEFIIGKKNLKYSSLKECQSSYNFTKFYSGLLLLIFGFIHLNIILFKIGFVDIILSSLIVLLGLIMIIIGLQERALIALQDLPQEFPSLFYGAFYFEFYLKPDLTKFYKIEAEKYLEHKWYINLLFYFIFFWIFMREFQILVRSILNYQCINCIIEAIISILFCFIYVTIILRLMFEKRIWYHFKFLDLSIKFPVFRRFSKSSDKFKYFMNQYKILFNTTNIKDNIKTKRGILTLISMILGLLTSIICILF